MRGYGRFTDLSATSQKTLKRISRGDSSYTKSCRVVTVGGHDYSVLYMDIVTHRITGDVSGFDISRMGYALYELTMLARELTRER